MATSYRCESKANVQNFMNLLQDKNIREKVSLPILQVAQRKEHKARGLRKNNDGCKR
jgi:ABC-type lipoprotein export system ATPase subunit